MSVAAQVQDDSREREFVLTDKDFRDVVAFVRSHAGIALAEQKRELVYSRLSRRLRALKLHSFADYLKFVKSDAGAGEVGEFINAITTNLTAFFRESHHFDHLRAHVIAPKTREVAPAGGKELLIWSAGCSSGEEPYSIAMTIADAWPNWRNNACRVLATDLDTQALERCRAGRYKSAGLSGVKPAFVREYFRPAGDDTVEVDPALRQMIAFKHLNLQGRWPHRRKYDAIFCRNVMIYFDDVLIREVLQGFHERLRPGGYLYIGHSESASKHHQGFERVDRTTYVRSA